MKDFKLDLNGDLVIEQGQLPLISGTDELLQKIRQVLGTNQGEWLLNPQEGIDFSVLLSRKPNSDLVRDTIKNALLQVDPELELLQFNSSYDTHARRLAVAFKFRDASGAVREVSTNVT